MKRKIDYKIIAKSLLEKFDNRKNKDAKYGEFMATQLLKLNKEHPKILNFHFIEELNKEINNLNCEHFLENKYYLSSLLPPCHLDDPYNKYSDVYIHAIEYYISFFLNGNRIIGDTVAIDGCDLERTVYKMCEDGFFLKKFNEKRNQYVGCVSSQFAKTLFKNEYPNCTWLFHDEDDCSSLGPYDLIFMGAYPTRKIGYKDDLQIVEDDYGKEYEIVKKQSIFGIDEEKYEEDLKNHLERIKGDGFLVTGLESTKLLTSSQQNLLVGIWRKNNLFIRLICRINNNRIFFILQRGKKRQGKYAVLDYCMSKESIDGEIILQSDYVRLRKLIEKARKWADNIPELQSIDSEIEYAGSFEDVKRMQEETDSIRRKIQLGFIKYNGKQLVDKYLGIREYNPKSNYGKIDMPVPCIYFPKTTAFFHSTGVSFSLLEMYKKICLSQLRYSEFHLDGIKWYEYCKKRDENGCARALKQTLLDTPWEQLNAHGPWFLGRDFEDVDTIEHLDPAYGRVGSDDEYLGDVKPTLLFFPETLLMEDGVYLRTIQKDKCNYKLWLPFARNDLEADYSPFQMILSEIIKSNIYIVPIDRDIVSIEYLKLYLQTIIGQKFMNDWKAKCVGKDVMDAFNQSCVYLPNTEKQKELLNEYEAAKTIMSESLRQKAQSQLVQSHTLSVIGGKDSFCLYQTVKKGTHGRQEDPSLFGNITNLPQPLAAVLYLNACDKNICKKTKNLIRFLEAAAIFHATVMFSILYHYDNNNKLSCRIVKDCFNKSFGKKSNKTIYDLRTDFGTWTGMCEKIVSELNLINGEKEIHDAFHLPKQYLCTDSNKSLVDLLQEGEAFSLAKQYLCTDSNRKLMDLLQEGRGIRNGDAHDGRKTDWNEKYFYDELRAFAGELKEELLNTYQSMDIEFGYDLAIVSKGKEGCVVTGYELSGENPRLKYFEMPIVWQAVLPPSTSKIYIRVGREFIPMIPFAVLGDLTGRDSQLKCMYYMESINFRSDEREYGEVEWHSFDCGEQSQLRYAYNRSFLPAQQLIELFHDSFCK